MDILKEVSVTLTKADLIELVCEKFELDKSKATLIVKERTFGDDRFGSESKEFDGIKITSQAK